MKNFKDGVHDPTIIKVVDKYYLMSTDTMQPKTAGVPIRSSENLVDWRFEKAALDGVPEPAKKWTRAVGLWAPEIIKVDDEFRMYYSASTFGSTTSMIGLATAKNILGPWTDQGEVVKTSPELAKHNAIDANVCYDRAGNPWMVYGSFFGGIHILRLDQKTGKALESGYGKCVAIRPQSVEGAIEGPFITYNEETDYFYLFVSFDSLNDSYNIRVGRSKEIDGPYLDIEGNDLTDLTGDPKKIGTKLLGSNQFKGEAPLYAPGHNAIFTDSDGQNYVVHHARRKKFSGEFFLQVRPLFWLKDGWPAISPAEYDGKITILNDTEQVSGTWQVVTFDENSEMVNSEEAIFQGDGTLLKNNRVISNMDQFVVYQSKADCWLLTGRDVDGNTIIGKRTEA